MPSEEEGMMMMMMMMMMIAGTAAPLRAYRFTSAEGAGVQP